jgi:Leucine-rich repeat (LRR) protein
MSRSTLLLPLFARTFLRALFLILLGGSTLAANFSHAAIPATERAALIALYNSTNGAGWLNRTNWRNAADTDFNAAGTECTWFGVSCSAGATNVAQISLENNNLSGTLPSTLNQLSQLSVFSATSNKLSGSVPSLDGLTQLSRVFLDRNGLSGAIPALTGLTSLQSFTVSDNQLSGSIPLLAGLDLREFNVSSNQLSGSIPPLTGLARLRDFNAGSNQLSGSIPSLAGLTELQSIQLSGNQLSGSIPSFAGLSKLAVFTAESNQLTGSIPALTGLPELELFWVPNNRLTGRIPELTVLSKLVNFRADNNQLTGPIPALTGLVELGRFWVFNNRLTGRIPELTGLTKLNDFFVNNNQLTGSMPSLAGLTKLDSLRLENNQLTGSIASIPTPTSALKAGSSSLCPNQFTVSSDPAWDLAAAGGGTTWSKDCTTALNDQALSFGAPPTLKVGGAGVVSVTASPTPNSSAPIVFASQTPLVCSVDSASGQVSVAAAAIAGNLCTITADKANDAAFNTAPQVQQSITIEAAVATFNVTPSASANGAISPNTAQAIASGATTSFTITPNAGYRIDTVTGCGGTLSGNTYTTAAITADCAVVATFALLVANDSLAVPTLGQWALLLLALMMVAAAAIANRAHLRASNRFVRAAINLREN